MENETKNKEENKRKKEKERIKERKWKQCEKREELGGRIVLNLHQDFLFREEICFFFVLIDYF